MKKRADSLPVEERLTRVTHALYLVRAIGAAEEEAVDRDVLLALRELAFDALYECKAIQNALTVEAMAAAAPGGAR